jgi:hypothetical protein
VQQFEALSIAGIGLVECLQQAYGFTLRRGFWRFGRASHSSFCLPQAGASLPMQRENRRFTVVQQNRRPLTFVASDQ